MNWWVWPVILLAVAFVAWFGGYVQGFRAGERSILMVKGELANPPRRRYRRRWGGSHGPV